LDLDVGSARRRGFRESSLRLGAGLLAAIERGPWRGELTWRLATGPLAQWVDAGSRRTGWSLATGPQVTGSMRLHDRAGTRADGQRPTR
jgi:hypothetical protein